MPNGVAAPERNYSLLPMPPAVEAIAKLGAATPAVTTKLLGLVADPTPEGAERYDGYGEGWYSLVITETSPRYLLMYQIKEEERVIVVVSIFPKLS